MFANLEEVVYLYRPTREGDFLKELLKDFHGVLVSDFYAAYDSIDCPQQKCLIHLMRDMNQELLNNPFDEELRRSPGRSGSCCVRSSPTIDQHGLKRRHLVKHAAGCAGVLPTPVGAALPVRGGGGPAAAAAEVPGQAVHIHRPRRRAVEQQQRRERHQAVRLLPGGRRGTISEKGLGDYLVLLSLYQTCRYRGISFLKFLKSGMRDLDAFRERGKPGRGQGLPAIQLYPKGFTPPHLLRLAKKRRVGKDATQGDDAIEQGYPEPEPPKRTHIENPSTPEGCPPRAANASAAAMRT